MVPVYSIGSFLSLLYYKKYAYWQILGDTYAAIAITSFFDLLCHYLAPTLQAQQLLFQDIVPRRWTVYLLGLKISLPVRWICGSRLARPDGSRWFKVNSLWRERVVMKNHSDKWKTISYGIYQYAIVRILVAILSFATQLTDRYCPGSNDPRFAHFWVGLRSTMTCSRS
jgi:hypothetical protein